MRQMTVTLVAASGLAACVADSGPDAPHAFAGTWDCGTTTLVLTNTRYTSGRDSIPITSVARDGRNYTLWLANGSVIGLAAVTETGLTRVSGQTGNQLNCRRVK